MLSVDGADSRRRLKGYANRNLENSLSQTNIYSKAELGSLTENDTLVINSTNFETALNDDALGRLVRFEGLTYKEGTYDGDKYPQYLETTYPNGSTTAVYENKYYTEEGLPPTYAYSYEGNRYYGSSWFAYDNTTSSSDYGNYILRVSGYSNFALQPLACRRYQR